MSAKMLAALPRGRGLAKAGERTSSQLVEPLASDTSRKVRQA